MLYVSSVLIYGDVSYLSTCALNARCLESEVIQGWLYGSGCLTVVNFACHVQSVTAGSIFNRSIGWFYLTRETESTC